MKILFKHGHLIVDENTEYLDGAILVEDDKILKVYPHSTKIKDEFEDTKIIDLKDSILMPAYFDCHYNNPSKGVTYYLRNIENDEIYHDDGKCLGYFIDDPNNINELINKYQNIKGVCVAPELNKHHDLLNNNSIKVLLGKSNVLYKDININYDGIRCIFDYTDELNSKNPSLANAAFKDDVYVEFNTNIDDSLLRIILKNITSKRLILTSDNMHESVIKLKKMNVDNTDILAYTSLNALRLYELDNHYGSLRKGKKASFNIMDKNYNIIFVYSEGVIYE